MKTKNTILLAAIILSSLNVSAQSQPATASSIAGRGDTFWVTNHTDKTLSVSLTRIEVRVGSEWKVYPQPKEPCPGLLYFSHPKSKLGWLAPHEAGSGKLLAQSISLPANGVWRAEFSVSEQLTGRERDEAEDNMRKAMRENPNTHLSLSSDSDTQYYGHSAVVYSDEVRPL
jgi:hypothetical protein